MKRIVLIFFILPILLVGCSEPTTKDYEINNQELKQDMMQLARELENDLKNNTLTNNITGNPKTPLMKRLLNDYPKSTLNKDEQRLLDMATILQTNLESYYRQKNVDTSKYIDTSTPMGKTLSIHIKKLNSMLYTNFKSE